MDLTVCRVTEEVMARMPSETVAAAQGQQESAQGATEVPAG
jgi:hypothetical protein